MNNKSETKNSMSPIKNITKKELLLQIQESDSMSVVSHYIHNRGYKYSELYEDKAKGSIKDIYGYDLDDNKRTYVAEDNVYYSLFDDFLSAPFIPIRNHRFTSDYPIVETYDGGDICHEDPYQIAKPEQLAFLAQHIISNLL